MKEVFGYIRDYFRYVNKKLLIVCTAQSAILIYLNYHYRLEWWLTIRQTIAWPAFAGHYVIFITAFALPYIFCSLAEKKKFFHNKPFIILLVTAPAIFSLKMALRTELPFSNDVNWNEYWNRVYYWPLRLVVVIAILILLWQKFDKDQPFYGLAIKNFKWKPYGLMLLCMLPLIAGASTKPDFLVMYPKIR